VKPLEPPDSFYVQAAQGWLELGSPAEAEAELAKVTPQWLSHPDAQKVRWGICASAKKWEEALEIAAALVALEPNDPLGWIHRSYALHELKRTAEARDHLLQVVERFPASSTIRYNLACYECRAGRMDEARKWLQEAFRLGDSAHMKSRALEDPDLAPLRPAIQEL
jgi:Flp pilus assembly protein TadD